MLTGLCALTEEDFASTFPIMARFSEMFDSQWPDEARQAPTVIELSGFLGPGYWGKGEPYIYTISEERTTHGILSL